MVLMLSGKLSFWKVLKSSDAFLKSGYNATMRADCNEKTKKILELTLGKIEVKH